MELALTDFREIQKNFADIMYRKPVTQGSTFFCEACYKTGRTGKKILFKTPRLKIIQRVRKNGKSYSFAVSFCDRDIDDDIQEFFDCVKGIDDDFKENKYGPLRRDYQLFEPKSKALFRQSLMRKTPNHSYYMRVKLLEKKTMSDVRDIRCKRPTSKCPWVRLGMSQISGGAKVSKIARGHNSTQMNPHIFSTTALGRKSRDLKVQKN